MLHRACVNFSNLIPWKLCWFQVCSRNNYDFWYVCREKSLQSQFSFDGWGESSTWIQPAGEHRLFRYQWPMGGSLHGLMSRRWELALSEVRKECKQTRKQTRTGRRICLNKKFDDERTCLQLWWVVSVIFFLKVPFFTLHLTFSLVDLPNPALFTGHVGTTLPCTNNLQNLHEAFLHFGVEWNYRAVWQSESAGEQGKHIRKYVSALLHFLVLSTSVVGGFPLPIPPLVHGHSESTFQTLFCPWLLKVLLQTSLKLIV